MTRHDSSRICAHSSRSSTRTVTVKGTRVRRRWPVSSMLPELVVLGEERRAADRRSASVPRTRRRRAAADRGRRCRSRRAPGPGRRATGSRRCGRRPRGSSPSTGWSPRRDRDRAPVDAGRRPASSAPPAAGSARRARRRCRARRQPASPRHRPRRPAPAAAPALRAPLPLAHERVVRILGQTRQRHREQLVDAVVAIRDEQDARAVGRDRALRVGPRILRDVDLALRRRPRRGTTSAFWSASRLVDDEPLAVGRPARRRCSRRPGCSRAPSSRRSRPSSRTGGCCRSTRAATNRATSRRST